jgi:hypothetical protein
MAIKLEYYKTAPYKKERIFTCPNNSAVVCDVKNFYYCGWNPTRAKLRMAKILEKGGIK